MDSVSQFLKAHNIDLASLLAAFLGALIAISWLPKITIKQAITVLSSGLAVNVYLVPLALHLLGWPTTGPVQSALGMLAGLLGMRVIASFMKWADKIENPADFLHPFKDDKK